MRIGHDYQQMFCHRPLTGLYSHFEVPSGGKSNDGKGFKLVVGNAGSGLMSTDGKSS